MRLLIFGLSVAVAMLLFRACDRPVADNGVPTDPVWEIVDRAIKVHGGETVARASIQFNFRQYHFVVTRDNGVYSYERTYTDEQDTYREVLDNDGITRSVNGQAVALTDDEKRRLLTPLNSVPYFALLPYNLSDPAVRPRILGTTVIGGESYDKIEVAFSEVDGGKDFEDRFVYWFHQERHTMDYLAYTFHSGDGGTRFREAHNVRRIGGVIFQDYHNYISDSLSLPDSPIEQYDDLFQAGELKLLSEIELKGISVTPLQP